jgi:hypothetical protein
MKKLYQADPVAPHEVLTVSATPSNSSSCGSQASAAILALRFGAALASFFLSVRTGAGCGPARFGGARCRSFQWAVSSCSACVRTVF